MPACGPVSEVAATPRSCRAIASRATDWSSPVESSWSISRGEGSRLTSRASLRSLSVCLPVAETVTTSPSPESWARFILSATALTCSVVATELPPYFWTMIPKNDAFRRSFIQKHKASGVRFQASGRDRASLMRVVRILTRVRSLRQRLASCHTEGLAVHVACLLGGEEHEGRGQLGGLGGATHGGGAAEAGDGIGGHGSGYDRGPHRTRRHGVGAEAVLYDLQGKPLGERDDGAFRAGVRQEGWRGLVGLDGAGLDDGPPRRHARKRRLDQPEHGVDVGLEGTVQQFGRDVGYPVDRHLVGRIIDEHVYPAELVHGLLDEIPAPVFVGDVSRYSDCLASRVLDGPGRLFGVGLFLFQVGEHDVRALAGEGERDGPSYTGVAARYDGLLAFQLAAPPVGLEAVVGLGLHLPIEAGVLVHLGLLRVLRLRVLLPRVLFRVLVFGHSGGLSCCGISPPFSPFLFQTKRWRKTWAFGARFGEIG